MDTQVSRYALGLIIATMLTATPIGTSSTVLASGVQRVFVSRTASMDGQRLRYRLHAPVNFAWSRLPLVLWLHGAEEAGDDNRRHLKWLELVFGDDRTGIRSPGCYVMAYQCPRGQADWQAREDGRDPTVTLMRCLQDVLTQYPVDDSRIYLIGISTGGVGVLRLLRQHPHRFAAALAMGTVSSRLPAIRKLHTPVWVFHSRADPVAWREQVRRLVMGLRRESSVSIRFTAVDSPTHDCWSNAFGQFGAMSWLLSQSVEGG